LRALKQAGSWLWENANVGISLCAFICVQGGVGGHSSFGFGLGGKVGWSVNVSAVGNEKTNGWALVQSVDLHLGGGANVQGGVNLNPHPSLLGGGGLGVGEDLGSSTMLVYTW
jgi:hypothetical protein